MNFIVNLIHDLNLARNAGTESLYMFYSVPLQKSKIDAKRVVLKLAGLSLRCYALVEEIMSKSSKMKSYRFKHLQGIEEESEMYACLQEFHNSGFEQFVQKCCSTKDRPKRLDQQTLVIMLVHYREKSV